MRPTTTTSVRPSYDSDEPIELAMYSDEIELGGTTRVAAVLIETLPARYRITVVGVSPEVVSWIASHRADTRRVVIAPVRGKFDVRGIASHVRTLRRLRPAILQVNLRHPWASPYGVLAGLLTRGTRVVVVENSPIEAHDLLQRRLRSRLARHYTAHVAVGHRVARMTESVLHLPPASVTTIHNGARFARPDVVYPRASAGPVVGTVARLSHEKGLDIFLRAVARLPDVTAVLVGDGPERSALESLADDLGILDRVIFEGWQEEPGAYLPGFDVFTLPSRFESFGFATLEAMQAGLAVVVSDVGSVSELVVDRETGLLVPPDDVDALVTALAGLLEDPVWRQQLGARGRERALSLFSAQRMSSEYERVYEEALA